MCTAFIISKQSVFFFLLYFRLLSFCSKMKVAMNFFANEWLDYVQQQCFPHINVFVGVHHNIIGDFLQKANFLKDTPVKQ